LVCFLLVNIGRRTDGELRLKEPRAKRALYGPVADRPLQVEERISVKGKVLNLPLG